MFKGLEDRWLVSHFLLTKSESAFRKLYSRHTPALYRFALQLSNGDGAAAEELVQDTWVRSVPKLGGFLWKSELQTWLVAILLNVHKEYRRKYGGIDLANSTEETEELGSINHTDRLDIGSAVKQLPQGCRIVFILHDMEGYKHYEISRLLEISEGTSKSQLFHARKILKKYLK